MSKHLVKYNSCPVTFLKNYVSVIQPSSTSFFKHSHRSKSENITITHKAAPNKPTPREFPSLWSYCYQSAAVPSVCRDGIGCFLAYSNVRHQTPKPQQNGSTRLEICTTLLFLLYFSEEGLLHTY